MRYAVDGWNNFCRVFRLPDEYPEGYCFGGAKPVTFMLEDWFYPVEGVDQAAVSKAVWEKEVGPVQTHGVDGDELQLRLVEWVCKKEYAEPGASFLVICDFGLAFTFEVPA